MAHFQYLVDAINKKLVGWKNKFLSPGGRLILIKHVLSAIPIHVMSALQPPKGTLNQLERLFSNFLWGRSEDSQRRIWRSWSRIAFPYDENGLGIRRLHDLVLAFSCKLWWKWQTGMCLWSKYVSSSSPSKSLIYKRLLEIDYIMTAHTRTLVLDGSCSFLSANWSGQGSIAHLFPDLLHCCPDVSLNEMWVQGAWRLQQLPHQIADFVGQFSFPFLPQSDLLVWELEESGLFSIRSALSQIRPHHTRHPSFQFLWQPLPGLFFLLAAS